MSYTDIEVVAGLQSRDRDTEEWFYNNCRRYFMSCFNKVFFDEDQKVEIFQDTFLRLWTQIEDGVISIKHDVVCRKQKDGKYEPMTCSLKTFLFSIARNEYREIVRNTKEIYVDGYFDNVNNDIMYNLGEDDETEVKVRVVDECIQMMSPRCLEILTLFYIDGKTLDEIMEIRKEKNTSKIGLKTAKYKCMNTLREKITQRLNLLNLKI